MAKNCFAKTIRAECVKDNNEKTPLPREDKQLPIEAEDKDYDMNGKDDEKEEEITPHKDNAFPLKAANYFIMNLRGKIIKEKERVQQSHIKAMKFLESIQSSLNAMSQSLINNPTLENTEMTAVSDQKDEEDEYEEGTDEDEKEEKRRKSSYVQITDTLIKQRGMYYIELIVNKKKHLVGPYSCPNRPVEAIKRFHERSDYLSPSAFLRELKQVNNYLAKRNAYKIG